MKKLITLLFAAFASLTVFGQVTEITPHPNDNFTYDGATLHHYGVGFHNYLDGLDGANLYGSGYFGIDFFTGGLHRLRISRHGNVGIGTTIPQTKLHISSGFIDEVSGVGQFGANAIIEATSTTRTIGQGAALGFVVPASTNGSNPWQQGRILVTPDNINNNDASGRMYIQTRYGIPGGWDWRNNLVLLSSGFVGIGTDKPDAMLTVNGTIHATEIKVDIAVPADYVFDPSYKLMPLSEVEKFVKEEKHLPEIPSAAEIKENGSNVGEMQNLLLQKVEELTLYTIELEKSRNEEIQKREALEARLAKLENMLQK